MTGWECGRYEGRINVNRVLVGKPEGKNRLEDLGVEGAIILK
jgi:hypothetical protein